MVDLVELGLANAAVAALLAVVALLVTRFSRRPALVHAVWLLVLIKLITPPLFRLPIPGLAPQTALAPKATVSRPEPAPVAPVVVAPVPAPPMRFTKIEDIGKPPRAEDMAPPVPAPAAGEAPPLPNTAPAVPVAEPEPEPEDEPEPAPSWLPALVVVAGYLWLSGAALWFLVAAWRVYSFQRLLRFATAAPEGLVDEVRLMSAHLGLSSPPSVWLIPGHLPPLIWAVGQPRLLLPAGLLEKLEAPGRSALILHELAHLARGDHWVRWVELVSSCLYWWYPVAWVARAHLNAAEEEACDAWVVSELPGYGAAYAGALLDTVDFLAQKSPPLPPAASAFGGLHRLKQRLATIIKSPAPRTVSAAGWAFLLLVALALPLTPVRGTAAPPPDEPTKGGPSEGRAGKDREAARDERRDPPTYRDSPRVFAGGGGQVWAVALSPDEKTLAAVTGGSEGEGAVALFDLATGKELACVVEQKPVRCVAFSPDGKWLATGDFENLLKLRDPRTAQAKRVLRGHTGSVNGLAFSGDSRTLLTASLDHTLKVWDVQKGVARRTLEGHGDGALSAALSRDGKTALSGSRDQTARLWDVSTGKLLHELRGHTAWVEGAALSPDGRRAATCGQDNVVKLWDVTTGKQLQELAGHTDAANAAAFTRDGKSLVSVSHDRTLRVWDAATGILTATHDLHAERIYGLALTSDGRAVTGSWDRLVKVSRLDGTGTPRPLQPRRYLPENNFPITALAVSPDGKLLAVGGEERAVKLLDAETGVVLRLLEGHEDAIGGLAFSPDGKWLASAGFDGLVALWDVKAGKLARTLKGHRNWVMCVAFSPDGKMLASGGYDRTVRLWSPGTGEQLASLLRHRGSVRAVAFSGKGMLASAGVDRTVRVWDLAKKEEALAIKDHDDAVRALAFSPDGRLASASEDGKVRLFDAAGKKLAEASMAAEQAPMALAFSPAGRLLAVAEGNTVRVADGRALTTINRFTRHTEAVTAVCFSPDGRVMYTAGKDRGVRAWPAAAEARLWEASFAIEEGQMWFHAFSPDGKRVASGGADGRLVVRPAALGSVTARVGGRLPAVLGAALSPDGKTFALACLDGSARLVDARTGKRLKAFKGHKFPVWSVAWSPDGKRLATAAGTSATDAEPGQVKVWDVRSGNLERELEGITSPAWSLAWSRPGGLLAVGQRNGEVLLFDAAGWKEKASLKNENSAARHVALSPDGATLAVGQLDGKVRLWDTARGKAAAELDGPSAGAHCVAFSPDGSALAVTSRDSGRLTAGEVWLFSKGKDGKFTRSATLKGHKNPIQSCAWSGDGRRLASCGGQPRGPGEAVVWDVAAGRAEVMLGGHAREAQAVAFTKDGKGLLTVGGSGTRDGEALLWNIAGGGWAVDNAHDGELTAACWSPDGRRLHTGSMDRAVRIWSASSGKKIGEWKAAHRGYVRCVAVSPDGKRVATCGADRLVKVWDAATGERLKELPPASPMPMTAAWSPDGKWLAVAVGGPFGRVKAGGVLVFDTATWVRRESGEWSGHAALSAAFSPDGERLAAGGMDTVAVYGFRTGKRLAECKGAHGTRCVAWSPDGRLLATAGAKGAAQVWDARTGREEAALSGHAEQILGLAFGPDGRLGTASLDGTARSWGR